MLCLALLAAITFPQPPAVIDEQPGNNWVLVTGDPIAVQRVATMWLFRRHSINVTEREEKMLLKPKLSFRCPDPQSIKNLREEVECAYHY